MSRGVGWSWTWPYATALAAVAVATVAGQLWVRDWIVAGSCALTRCNPQSMAFVGWATLGPVTVFLVGLISAQLRTRDPWAGRTLHGPRDAALDAFGNGWTYAVAGIVVVGIGLFPAAMWQEARTYRRFRAGLIAPGGPVDIRRRARVLVACAGLIQAIALVGAELGPPLQ